MLSDVVPPAHDLLFCTIPYGDFREFGPWTVTPFVNGRVGGATAVVVKAAVYGRELRPTIPVGIYRAV